MLWHRQAIFKSKGDKLSSSAECRFELRVSDTKSPADWMPADKPTELSRIKLKTWARQPVPMISEHSAHLTSLPVGFRTWLWRYTCLWLLMSMLWDRQTVFKSKGDKLSSSAECRFEPRVSDTKSQADWMHIYSIPDWIWRLYSYLHIWIISPLRSFKFPPLWLYPWLHALPR